MIKISDYLKQNLEDYTDRLANALSICDRYDDTAFRCEPNGCNTYIGVFETVVVAEFVLNFSEYEEKGVQRDSIREITDRFGLAISASTYESEAAFTLTLPRIYLPPADAAQIIFQTSTIMKPIMNLAEACIKRKFDKVDHKYTNQQYLYNLNSINIDPLPYTPAFYESQMNRNRTGEHNG